MYLVKKELILFFYPIPTDSVCSFCNFFFLATCLYQTFQFVSSVSVNLADSCRDCRLIGKSATCLASLPHSFLFSVCDQMTASFSSSIPFSLALSSDRPNLKRRLHNFEFFFTQQHSASAVFLKLDLY